MAKQRKPIPTLPMVSEKAIPSPKAAPPKNWAFSFRFWRQIEFFALNKCKPEWFVSLLDRFAELSTLDIDEFRSDRTGKGYRRYHPIDWDHKNIPIKREDLDWIDRVYLDNPDDYPLMQFMVSKALGRVAGFWDETDVFNVVLLDPLHNIQPAGDFSYKVDPCSPLSCELSSLLISINDVRAQQCIAEGCPVRSGLDSVGVSGERRNVMVISVDDGIPDLVSQILSENKATTVGSIFEAGILVMDTESVPQDKGQSGTA